MSKKNETRGDQYNPKGYFENQDFVRMNDAILQAVGCSWYKPPEKDRIDESKFSPKDIRLFLSNQQKTVWGLKDPRTLLTFEVWKPYFAEIANITYVFMHRPFESSVRSLANRNQITLKEANRILTPYLKNLYHYRHTFGIDKHDIIDIYFEEILQNPRPFVAELNRRLGRNANYKLKEVKKFLDANLKKF